MVRAVTAFALTAFAASIFPAAAKEIHVASPGALGLVAQAARPGDTIVLENGTYQDQFVEFNANGTEASPITLKAATPGGVTLSGKSSLQISGSYLVIDGLQFRETVVAPVVLKAHHSRITNVAIIDCNPEDDATRYHWLQIAGADSDFNRIDHCYFSGKTKSGVVLAVDGNAATMRMSQDNRIDHNYFKDVTKAVQNGMETIRIGTSTFGQMEARAIIEDNLFENASGDAEIISSKSCGNIVRRNTFLGCDGAVVMRHGHRGCIEDNIFLGNGRAGAGGVRVLGTGHKVARNYFEGLQRFSIALPVGQANFVPTGWEPVKDAIVEDNFIVNPTGPAIQFGLDGAGKARKNDPALHPRETFAENVTLSGNIISGGDVPSIEDLGHGTLTWKNNRFFTKALGFPATPGIELLDKAPSITRPKALTHSDVGPSWLKF